MILAKARVRFHFFSRLTTTEEMLSLGLFLNDLNFYDGSSEILISGIQHTRQLQTAIAKVRENNNEFLSCFKAARCMNHFRVTSKYACSE